MQVFISRISLARRVVARGASATNFASLRASHTLAIGPSFRRRKPVLPIISTNITPLNAQEAVDNILYNTPAQDFTPSVRHTLNCLVANEPGVLSRVSGILAGRGINIDSLVVARTEVDDLSRMTIVINCQDEKIEQARKQLEDIVPVWAVLDYSKHRTIDREMLLVKVATVPHEFESVGEYQSEKEAKIVDVGFESVVVELTAKPDRIDSFLELLKPFGILEAARSGTMVMPRTQVGSDKNSVVDLGDETEAVDLTMLPPG